MQNVTTTHLKRSLAETDPDIARAIQDETRRQAEGLELIASENFVSEAVLEAAGSVFTNKYAEGYPGKRYYGGCEFVDQAEELARERLKKLFGAEYANVQPHSGSQANMAVYFTFLKPGDKVIVYTNLRSFTYIITGWELVKPTQVEVMAPTPDASITLISCHPYLVDNHRIVVKGNLVG